MLPLLPSRPDGVYIAKPWAFKIATIERNILQEKQDQLLKFLIVIEYENNFLRY
jgi:hypothetical protein